MFTGNQNAVYSFTFDCFQNGACGPDRNEVGVGQAALSICLAAVRSALLTHCHYQSRSQRPQEDHGALGASTSTQDPQIHGAGKIVASMLASSLMIGSWNWLPQASPKPHIFSSV